MSPTLIEQEKYDLQRSLLLSDVGPKGSGAARYAAAMYFYMRGEMSEQMLEIYRRCSKFDNEDALDLARHEGVRIPSVSNALTTPP